MGVQLAPPLLLISSTPPSQPPPSNENRCEKVITRDVLPTRSVGEVRICSSGRLPLTSSIWPLLSGPHQTCWTGESARRCHPVMFGSSAALPETVQPGFTDSTDSVAEDCSCSL